MPRFGPGFVELRRSLERSRPRKYSFARLGRLLAARHTAEGFVEAAADTVGQFGSGIVVAGGRSEGQRSVAVVLGLRHRTTTGSAGS